MAVPKRRTTRAKSKMRRAQHDKVTAPNLAPCANCGEPVVPHRVCPSCGFYKGQKVAEKKLTADSRQSTAFGPRALVVGFAVG